MVKNRRSLHRSRVVILALSAMLFGLSPDVAFAQITLPENIRRAGDEIRFCVNRDSVLADLDRAVAQRVAEALLLPAVIHEIGFVSSMRDRYEFGLPVDELGLLTVLTEKCQVVVGFQLTKRTPYWVSVTQPYYATNVVMAFVANGDNPASATVSLPSRIGSRMAGAGDAGFSRYLNIHSPDSGLSRIPYPHNGALLSALLNGSIGGAVIWEPAVYAASGGDPLSRAIAVRPLPFVAETVDFGMAVLSNDAYMRTALDQGIRAVLAEDVVASLAKDLRLPPPAHSNRE